MLNTGWEDACKIDSPFAGITLIRFSGLISASFDRSTPEIQTVYKSFNRVKVTLFQINFI